MTITQHITVGKGTTVHLAWESGRFLPWCNPGIAAKAETHLTTAPITCKRCTAEGAKRCAVEAAAKTKSED